MSTPLTGFPGLDYAEDIVLLERGQPLTLAQMLALSRLIIRLDGGADIDSDDETGVFEWPIDTEWDKRPAKGVRVRLGEAGLPPGKHEGLLIVFDPDHPRGLPWDRVTLGIKGDA